MFDYLTKKQLFVEIETIEKRQKGEVFSAPTIKKLLGTSKTWKSLKKNELIVVLNAWKEMLAKCPQTANWETLPIGDRIVCVTADGQRWVDYFGFPSMSCAEAFLEQILPDCHWAMLRKSGKRVNASVECKVWGLEAEKFEAMIGREKERLSPKMTVLYHGISGSKFQTYLKMAESEKIQESNALNAAELQGAIALCQSLGGQVIRVSSVMDQETDLASMVK